MTPIERAAQAMHASAQPEWSWDDPDYAQLRAIYRDAAKAMIASLRVPSRAMGAAVGKLADEYNAQFDIDPEEIWATMIDAALSETETEKASQL